MSVKHHEIKQFPAACYKGNNRDHTGVMLSEAIPFSIEEKFKKPSYARHKSFSAQYK
jgi:hypothetical protein